MTNNLHPMKLLDRAMTTLSSLGIRFETVEDAPIVAMIEEVASLDPARATMVAKTLQNASAFNAVVRDHIDAMNLADRYNTVTQSFNSIRDDGKMLLSHLDDGKVSLGEKASQVWMKLTRGDIPSRFEKIKKIYLEVAADSKEQIERERAILNAYKDFREVLKECEVIAHELLKTATGRLEEKRAVLDAANNELNDFAGEDDQRARLELERDRALRDLQDEDRRYQVAKDLAENLQISYSTGEVVMARLAQTSDVKERVYRQAVTFFATNETVFTAINAAMTSMHGLHEGTQTLNAMKEGMNESIESLADVGDQVLTDGLKAGYGPTLRVESVKKLVDAVVRYQETSTAMIDEMRRLSTSNANEISRVVEDGKQRFVALTKQVPATPAAPAEA